MNLVIIIKFVIFEPEHAEQRVITVITTVDLLKKGQLRQNYREIMKLN